jgi:ABC-2 type transport system ATP-binding protein
MNAAMEISGLVVRYGDRCVVDDLNLTIPPGTIYALLGGNGAGKTTTINTLLGFVKPERGRVLINGSVQSAGSRELAYLPENVALYPYLSGVENVQYFCALAGTRVGKSEANVLLARAGLPEHAMNRRVSTYSKGMRQKVGLSIAYARNARAMLLDEPTSGLDPDAANEFAMRIRALGSAGMAVLMATHDLFNAREVADRIGIMKAGRIVAEIDARRVSHQELHDTYLTHVRVAA